MIYKYLEIDANEYKERYNVPSLIAKLLKASSLTNDKCHELLDNDMTLKTSKAECVLKAVERIKAAKANNEKVFVGGDYDADGICSTAIMVDILNRLGIKNGYYIPDRFKEGYGLNVDVVKMVKEKGYDLIITVDNGVSAFEAIKAAKELGIDIIITDHHIIQEKIEAVLVVHPLYMEEDYKYLSGAGVVYQISRNLFGDIPLHTVLACIALIGDVMELWKQTRVIVKKGLEILNSQNIPAISGLLNGNRNITSDDIAYQIVPKLNSVGRLHNEGNVNTLVTYLLSDDIVSIEHYKNQLNNINNLRKTRTKSMVDKIGEVESDDDFLIFYDESFDEGLNGLVAGRLSHMHNKPILVFSKNEDILKGSGRSIVGFDMFSFFNEGFDELVGFGGHSQAVGLSVKEEDFESFKTNVYSRLKEFLPFKDNEKKVILLSKDDLSIDNVQALKALDPLPKEISSFLFAIKDPKIIDIKEYTKVTRYIIEKDDVVLEAVSFDKPYNSNINYIIGNLSINEWNNNLKVELIIDSIQ